MKLLGQLYIQVLIGIALAIGLAMVAPTWATAMKPLGDAFIALLRMMLAPIIFCSVVLGVSHVGDMRQLGRLAIKALVYFEVLTTIGMGLGFAVVNLVHPGSGLHATDVPLNASVAKIASTATDFTAVHFILSIIPETLFSAFTGGQILQVLFVSILVGAALAATRGGKRSQIRNFVEEAQDISFNILGFIMRLAPIGAFGAMAAAIGSFGTITLVYLAKLVALYWLTTLFFVIVILGLVATLAGLSLLKICDLIRDELVLVFGTASGEVVLPRLIAKLEEAGCDKAVVGFVLPAGYSFNLGGTSIYMAIAVGFIAQATDTPFSWQQQLAVLAVLMLTSKGGTTVAGGAFVKLAATLQSVRTLPLGGLSLLFGVDRLMATGIALSNVLGNALAVFVIARWENLFDQAKFDAYRRKQSAGSVDPSGMLHK